MLFVGCSEGSEDNDGPDTLLELDCGEGYPYTINGAAHCIFYVDGPDQQECPEGLVVSIAQEMESEEGTESGEVYICSDSTETELSSIERDVLNNAISEIANHGAGFCDDYGSPSSSNCGECVCDSCVDGSCEHTRCEMEECAAGAICEDQQCVVPEEIEGLTCDNVVERFQPFVDEHLGCETVDDCRSVGRTETCDCAPTLGHSNEMAINKEGAPVAGIFYDLFNSDECADVRDQNQQCDSGPGENLRCEDGVCRIDEEECFF